MSNHKIIFTGPVAAGKSTAIASISDSIPISTDETASDMTKNHKAATTVAMDYGIMNLDGGERLHLYGTPGQERFDFMWDILTQGGVGLVLLINNSTADPFRDMRFFLKAFASYIGETRVVIGVTRMDEEPQPTIADYHLQLTETKHKIPIFEVDARQRRDVALLIEALLYSLDPGLVA
jgi:uncharacterized protein